jgi:prephenate dehydratase
MTEIKDDIIAFQGNYGANSDISCRKFYPDLKAAAYKSFHEVFNAVKNGEAKYGMIPLENSYAGRVSEIHNLLQETHVSIVAEHFIEINHNLCGIKGAKAEDIKQVYSHPQALMQCRETLLEMAVEQTDHSNTALAAKYVADKNDKTKAALCSNIAAKLNNLEIIKENIQDSGNDNMTIFIVIAKDGIDPDPSQGKVITTMLFNIRNIPGALYKSLGGFATNGVNMIKLESYIPGGISSQAKFFISIEGHPSQKNVSLALEEMGFFSKTVKVLGVYHADKSRT